MTTEPMSLKSNCPKCGHPREFAGGEAGHSGRCENCDTVFESAPDALTQLQTTNPDPLLWDGPEDDEDAVPAAIGRYQILRKLGQGGMGRVYLAYDAKLDRRVALKVPLGDFKRFRHEARIAAQFQHPNFCVIHDTDEEDGVPFLVMAYIEGQSLEKTIIYREPWELHHAVELVCKLAIALAEAHRKGIVHRDLKPANVMIDGSGQLILMDFGLARQANIAYSRATSEGQAVGTAAYMPPEQARGEIKRIGPRSDIYSLGVILYELVTGRRPFEGQGLMILSQVAFDDPPKPSSHHPGIDPVLEGIILKAIAKAPEDRHGSMDEFAQELRAWPRASQTAEGIDAIVTPAPKTPRIAPPSAPSREPEQARRSDAGGRGSGARKAALNPEGPAAASERSGRRSGVAHPPPGQSQPPTDSFISAASSHVFMLFCGVYLVVGLSAPFSLAFALTGLLYTPGFHDFSLVFPGFLLGTALGLGQTVAAIKLRSGLHGGRRFTIIQSYANISIFFICYIFGLVSAEGAGPLDLDRVMLLTTGSLWPTLTLIAMQIWRKTP